MRLRKQGGITLIALIVTVVVLLILAGISINVLFGDSGLIKRSQDVAKKTEMTKIKEMAEMVKANVQLEGYVNYGNSSKVKKAELVKALYDHFKKESELYSSNTPYSPYSPYSPYTAYKENDYTEPVILPSTPNRITIRNGKYDIIVRNNLEILVVESGKNYLKAGDVEINVYYDEKEEGTEIEVEAYIETAGEKSYMEFATEALKGKTNTEKESIFIESDKYVRYGKDVPEEAKNITEFSKYMQYINEQENVFGNSDSIPTTIEEFREWLGKFSTVNDMLITLELVNVEEYESNHVYDINLTCSNGEQITVNTMDPSAVFTIKENGKHSITATTAKGEKGKVEFEIKNIFPVYEMEEDNTQIDVSSENTAFTDSEGKTVTIPKGFAVSNVPEEQIISKGLVIKDKSGNEFVWVPVEYTATGKDTNNNELDDGFESSFKSRRGGYFSEPYANGYKEEKDDYMKMMKSVQKYRGFYIGRYETGTRLPRTNKTTTTSDIVVKRDAYPYIYTDWGKSMNDVISDTKSNGKGAAYISQTLYPDISKYTEMTNDTGVISTLCYGAQLDATKDFIRKDGIHSLTNSASWGNYRDNAWTIDRKNAKYANAKEVAIGKWTKVEKTKTKTNSESYILTTGASDSFKAQNIFDLAGNVWELTMEAYSDDSRAYYGGAFWISGNYTYGCADYCTAGGTFLGGSYGLGFRIALYIQN